MFFKKAPEVKLLFEPDLQEINWCESAVVVSVKNGKGLLTHIYTTSSKQYESICRLTLNGKPLVQGEYPFCPTCEGLMAAGCGLENVDCKELEAIRRNLNESYSDIKAAAESLIPLLELLDDGYYLIADIPHYPTDGDGHFFYNMPNKLTYYDGCCDSYYLNAFYTAESPYPAFLIPTQSADIISRERIDHYKEKLKASPDSVRALAFHEYGFFSALLDGHHKAFAAAELGLPIRCITVIKGHFFRFSHHCNEPNSGVCFCDLHINEGGDIAVPEELRTETKNADFNVFESSVAGRDFDISCNCYPTAYELAIESALSEEEPDFFTAADDMIKHCDNENKEKLKAALVYYLKKAPEKAKELALKIIGSNCCDVPVKEAWKTLTHFRDPETEKLFVDFLINESKAHYAYDTVNSYWDYN